MNRLAFTCFSPVLLALLCLGISPPLWAQRTCGTMEHLEHQLQENPSMQYRMRQIEENARLNLKGAGNRMQGQIIIPVVVHVVYRSSRENISEAQVQSQIEVLNADFQRLNLDAADTDPRFAHLATGAGIEFRLATVDPLGTPTNGITRTRTDKVYFYTSDNGVKYSSMGGVDAWPSDQYLNIWVCNLGMSVLGYAQFPGGAPETDGVVICYKQFGNTGSVTPPFDRGRTCTHEVGHWLNLRHIWGDGACEVDDLVPDTPPADGPTTGCPQVQRVACSGPVMTQNFMDYTDDACMNFFTRGQVARMRSLFINGGARHSLLRSPAIQATAPLAQAFPPQELSASEIHASRVRLSWAEVPGAERYEARFKTLSGTEWASRSFQRTYVYATQLDPCTDYEFQIRALVGGRFSNYSPSYRFRTGGCPATPVHHDGTGSIARPLTAPQNLFTKEVGPSQATLHWESVPGASSYVVQYKVAGPGQRTFSKMVPGPRAVIPLPYPDRQYFFRVAARQQQEQGEYSEVGALFAATPMALAQQTRSAKVPAPNRAYLHARYDRNTGKAQVLLQSPAPLNVDILVENASGKTLQAYEGHVLRPQRPFVMDFRAIPPGRYQLIVRDENGFEHRAEVRK